METVIFEDLLTFSLFYWLFQFLSYWLFHFFSKSEKVSNFRTIKSLNYNPGSQSISVFIRSYNQFLVTLRCCLSWIVLKYALWLQFRIIQVEIVSWNWKFHFWNCNFRDFTFGDCETRQSAIPSPTLRNLCVLRSVVWFWTEFSVQVRLIYRGVHVPHTFEHTVSICGQIY